MSHLVLYLDVNKTMIMMDPVQGKDVEHVLNDLLAEDTYGIVDPETKEWKIDEEAAAGTTISYSNYLRKTFPNSGVEVQKNKQQRKQLRSKFAHKTPQVQSKYASLLEQMRLPTAQTSKQMEKIHGISTDYHFLLPGVYYMLLALEKENVSFSVVLRTFGQDIDEVRKEWNAFCRGEHPLYPEVCMDGSRDGSVDRRIHETNGIGTFYRTDDQVSLVLGTLEQQGLEFYTDHEILTGYKSIYEFMIGIQGSFAIRDHYHYWWRHQEAPHAGKLLLVHPQQKERVRHVFFDDNILEDDPHIVDIRDVTTGQTIPFEQVKHRELVPVDPIQAIQSLDYFWKQLQCSIGDIN